MGSVPAAAHFLGKKCQYNVSGSDSVHSISAVILYVTMWLIFLGNARSPTGCSIPHTGGRAGTSLPWKPDRIRLSEGIAEPCGLVWGEREMQK